MIEFTNLRPNQIGAGKAVERLQVRYAVHLFWPGLPDLNRSLTMKASVLFMLLLLTVVRGMADGKPTLTIVALPRPNSGTFSFQQAEARKSEILSNAPTAKTEKWKNPYMGFRIHIGKDDSLEVYDHWMKGSARVHMQACPRCTAALFRDMRFSSYGSERLFSSLYVS